MDQNVDNLD
jgi:hypothetical protein